ncbi:MAG: BBP7 family outer membrane beta-barrel protein, partial [Planctomycetota bacterium]
MRCRWLAAGFWLLAVVASPLDAKGQNGESNAPWNRPPGDFRSARQQPRDRAEMTREADLAVGQLFDSLFAPFAPADFLPGANDHALGGESSKALRRPKWEGRLVHNPDDGDGNPAYALVDRYGGIIRYVEPTGDVDLDRYVGETVGVRRDTGHTLLASQLALPRSRESQATGGDVGLAQHQEPIPAGDIEPDYSEPAIVPDGVEPLYLDQGINFGGCDYCGDACGGVCGGGPCGFGSRPIWYVRGEYLLWWFDGMDTPALVVEGTAEERQVPNPGDPAGDPLTMVVFVQDRIVSGQEELLNSSRSGYRITLGTWLDDYGKWGLEVDHYGFDRVNSSFVDGGTSPAQVGDRVVG